MTLASEWSGPKLVALLAAVASLAGAMGSCTVVMAEKIGLTVTGTPELVQVINGRLAGDSVFAHRRIDINADRIHSLDERVKRLEQVVEIWTYIQCVQIRRVDPAALPPSCPNQR